MSAENSELTSTIEERRETLRRLLRETRWLKRAALGLAVIDLVALAVVVHRWHWETFGG